MCDYGSELLITQTTLPANVHIMAALSLLSAIYTHKFVTRDRLPVWVQILQVVVSTLIHNSGC